LTWRDNRLCDCSHVRLIWLDNVRLSLMFRSSQFFLRKTKKVFLPESNLLDTYVCRMTCKSVNKEIDFCCCRKSNLDCQEMHFSSSLNECCDLSLTPIQGQSDAPK
jgi:hypothetical protein